MATHVGGKSKIKRTSADNRWMIISTSAYLVTAFYDDTKIFANGTLVDTVNKQQIKSINFSANDIIYSNKPISFSRSGSGQTGLCYAFQGTQFAHRFDRYTNSIYIVATEQDASVTITRGSSTSYWSGTVSTTSYTTVSTSTTYDEFIIESDNNIAVYVGQLPSADSMPLYPCSLELFGTASSNGHILAIEDNTTIYEYSTSGSSRSFTLNRGGVSGFSYTGSSQFAGDSVRLVADKPIAAESQADADGGEMTPFIGKDGFGTQFVIPEDEREFVKIVSDVAATVEAYDTSGNLLSTTTLSGSSANEVYNAYLTGTSSYEGVLIKSDLPVTAIYEGAADDETILFAHQPEDVRVEYGPKIVTDGLVLYLDAANPKSYPGSGTTWTDLSGNDNDGTLVGGVAYSSDNAGSLSFDGSNDYATFSYPIFTTPSELSIGGFFKKVSGGSNYETVLHQGASTAIGTSSYWFGVDSNDNIVATIGATTGVGWSAGQTTITVSYDTWYCVFASWNGTTVSVYVDGSFVKSYSLSTYTDPGTVTRIGASGNSTGYLFSGFVGPTFIYTKGLTGSEVKQNFDALRGRYGI